MTFYPNERIALFIDGANFYASAKAVGIDVDYKRLLAEFRKRGRLIRASYYTALVEDADKFSPLKPLIDWLDYNGWTVVTKPARTFTDHSGQRRFRGDMDVDLAVDAMEAANSLDHIVLFSGDGDFVRLVKAVQRKGVRVTVVSSLRSDTPMVSDDLRRQADVFIDISELASIIGRDPASRPERPERAPSDEDPELDDEHEDEDDDEFEHEEED